MAIQLNPQSLERLRQPPAQAFPIFISETTGEGRTIVLRGRSLPYRGVTWNSEQRVEVKYFPGNPVGQAQVLGPMWGPTTMRGMWKDAFLFNDDSCADLLNFPAIAAPGLAPGEGGPGTFGGKSFASGGSVPGSTGKARRARTLRDAMYLIQRGGQLLKVEWGSMVRYGFIGRFDADHDREEDIRWEIEFKWIGDTNSISRPIPKPAINAPGLLALILETIQQFLDQVNAALALIFGSIQLVTQRITKIGQLVAGFVEALNKLTSLVFVPAELFGVLNQQLTSIILAVKDLLFTINRVPQQYLALKEGADFSQVNLATSAAQAIAFNSRVLGVEAAEQQGQLQELESPNLLGVVTATEGTTLLDIATSFYGAPDGWVQIAEFNGFSSSFVERGTLVYVPRQEEGVSE